LNNRNLGQNLSSTLSQADYMAQYFYYNSSTLSQVRYIAQYFFYKSATGHFGVIVFLCITIQNA
jgi:hypothetical protein